MEVENSFLIKSGEEQSSFQNIIAITKHIIMELLLKPSQAKGDYYLADELKPAKDKILSVIGRDFNKSVANILGLISLLNDSENCDQQDFNDIRRYLTIEANKLNVLVKDICC